MKLRTLLILLNLLTVLPLLVLAAAAGWLYATGRAVLQDDMLWLTVAALCATLLLAALLPSVLARRLSHPLAAIGGMAKALASGAPTEPPAAPRVREIAEVSEVLTAAAHAVRAREKSLRDADRAKDEFVAMLSHELRNPLGALAAAAQVLRRVGPQEGGAAQAGEVVARQVEHMSRMVEDLLDVSRVTRGKVSLARQAFNLSELVDNTIAEMRTAGRLANHEVRLDLVPVWVRADEARVAQIVTNLVGNAVKYTPNGGQVVVSLRRDRDIAVLRVRDSGIGMSPELAGRVFDLFVQGERSLDRGQGGLGIGLTLVKHLAELQGGKAYAASAGAGQGSTFTVTLPATEPQPERAEGRTAAERRRHRIVLIEDNEDARRSLAEALSIDGHQVHEAADGITGIAALARVNPDVAVVDIGLPGVDGYKVAETLRGSPEHDAMVLIALTGYGQPDSLRRAREAGFDEYVTKPIAPDRLVRLMDVALDARAKRAATPPAPRGTGQPTQSQAGR